MVSMPGAHRGGLPGSPQAKARLKREERVRRETEAREARDGTVGGSALGRRDGRRRRGSCVAVCGPAPYAVRRHRFGKYPT